MKQTNFLEKLEILQSFAKSKHLQFFTDLTAQQFNYMHVQELNIII